MNNDVKKLKHGEPLPNNSEVKGDTMSNDVKELKRDIEIINAVLADMAAVIVHQASETTKEYCEEELARLASFAESGSVDTDTYYEA